MKKILLIISLFVSITTYSQSQQQGSQRMFNANNVTVTASCPSDADAATYLTAISNSNSTFCTAVDNFFIGAKSYSVFTKLKGLYFTITGSSSTSIVNAVSPGTHNAVAHGTITFASTGATSNGSTGYLDLSFSPASTFTTTSGMVACLIRTNVASNNGYDIASDDGAGMVTTPIAIISRYNTDIAASTFGNPSYTNVVASTDSRGFLASNRLSGVTYLYKDGSSLASATESVVLPTNNLYALAANAGGSANFFSTKEFSLIIVADGLTSTEMSNLNTLVQAFKTTMGL